MYEKILKLKDKNKLLFYLLFIPFCVIFIYEIYNKFIVAGAKKDIKDAENKDDKLKKKQQDLEKKAQEHKDKADEIGKKAQQKNTDKDWHLK